jgi:hypothetical protein
MRLLLGLGAGFLLTVELFAAQPIVDETLRRQALASIFPGMEVQRTSRRPQDVSLKFSYRWPLVFPDALAGEQFYRVTGPPMNEEERCAAQDMINRKTIDSREVRFQLFPWPGSARGQILAVVQYRFDGARPSASCTAIATLLRLTPADKHWEAPERITLDTHRHHHLEGIQLIRLTDANDEDLVVESDSGDGGGFSSGLHVFSLSHGRFLELLNVPSRILVNLKSDQWTQTLDIPRTVAQQGDGFCFVKTVYAADLRSLSTPLVTKPCYPRGEGVGAAR